VTDSKPMMEQIPRLVLSFDYVVNAKGFPTVKDQYAGTWRADGENCTTSCAISKGADALPAIQKIFDDYLEWLSMNGYAREATL